SRDERAVAKLTAIVPTPAGQHAVRADSAGVRHAGADLCPRKAARDPSRSRSTGCKVTELPLVVRPPAVRLARLRDRAGVPCAGADRNDLHARKHRLRRGRARITIVPRSTGRVAVDGTELSVSVASP